MTLEEKEKLIKSFKSFKFNPESNIREEYINVGIDWCIEEFRKCNCGEKDKLDELLEKYNAKITKIDDLLDTYHTKISNIEDLMEFAKDVNCTLSDYDSGIYDSLNKVVDDLESLRDK